VRGPDDQIIDKQLGTEVDDVEPAAAGDKAGPVMVERPPGGKVLLRMLQLLGNAGYEDTAVATVNLAVDPSQQRTLRDRGSALVAMPAEVGRSRTTKKTAKKATKKTAKKTATADAATSGIAEEVASAYIAAAEQLGPPTATGPQWRSLGPWTVPNGQTYGASRVNVSGRISSIAVDPSNAAHVLVGAANGGVWQSFDRGASWSPRTDYAATTAIGAVTFDPTTPTKVYAGLGEGNWWWWLGAGILRSTDGGSTWSTLCTTPFVGQGFYDLAVDPRDGNHLYAATTGGLYVTTNGGTSWTRRHSSTCWSVAIGIGRRHAVWAACSDGLFRSGDSGVTWDPVTLPGAPAGFTRLAVAASRVDTAVGYAWGTGAPFDTNGNPTAYFWRRQNATWTAQPIPPGVGTGQSWYDWFLATSPDNADEVYLGAISAWRGNRSGTTWTWTDVATKSVGDSIHPDQHAIAFEPGNPATIYIGNDGGLYQSTDRGVHWTHRNNGLVITEFEYLAQNLGSSHWLLGGTQDNGTERWQGSSTWEHVADGDGGDCAVNRTTPTTVFHTFYGMSPQRSTSSGDWATWANITPPVPSGEGSSFYPPFEASATNGDTIAMAGNALYVSRNNGTAWSRLGYPSGGGATALFIPNADTVLVGMGDGRILRTTWSGTAWNGLAALTTPRSSAAVSDIAVDENNASRMWATYSTVGGGRVYLSTDGGSTWTDRSTGLPNLSVTAIALDPWNSNRAWVSASLGVYQTWDGGGSWTGFSSSLPNAYVGDLIFHRHARVLRAGLRNRGAWEIPVDGWMTAPICGTQWTGSLAGNQTLRWFTFNWPAVWHIIWTVMPTNVRNGAPQVTWKTQVERASAEYATYWISVTNLTPDPLTFEGRYCILSRY
jgi:hypothetical protein